MNNKQSSDQTWLDFMKTFPPFTSDFDSKSKQAVSKHTQAGSLKFQYPDFDFGLDEQKIYEYLLLFW